GGQGGRHHPLCGAEDLRHDYGRGGERLLRVRRGDAGAHLPAADRHSRQIQRLCHLPAAGAAGGRHCRRPGADERRERPVRGHPDPAGGEAPGPGEAGAGGGPPAAPAGRGRQARPGVPGADGAGQGQRPEPGRGGGQAHPPGRPDG
ncbi:relaxase MobL, partial [Dysosmobacter welbionis]